MYEMTAGYAPFCKGKERSAEVCHDPLKIYENVISGKVQWPHHFTSDLKDLLKNLLQVNPNNRFGSLNKGVNHIKNHKWFSPINWTDIFDKKVEAPYVPCNFEDCGSTSCIFEGYDFEALRISCTEECVSEFNEF